MSSRGCGTSLNFLTYIGMFIMVIGCLEVPTRRLIESDASSSPQDLMITDTREDVGVDMNELEDVGVDMNELEDVGVDMNELEDVGVDMHELEDVGIEVDQMMSVDGDVIGCRGEPPLCSLHIGVCAERYQVCFDDQWVDCIPQDFGEDYQQNETRCDCLDNDCDGLIDENGFGGYLACPITDFKQGAERDCVLRQNSIVSSDSFYFRSLTLAENIQIDVTPDSSAGFPANRPCHIDPIPMTAPLGGGGIHIYAEQVLVRQGARITASVENSSHCQLNSNDRGVYGASGGDVFIIANQVELAGELVANGGEGGGASGGGTQPGGAGGTVQVYAQLIIFRDSGRIISQGGRISVASQSGPGAGRANLGGAGAGENGMADPNRAVRLVGQVQLPDGNQSFIFSQDGADGCTGLVDLWGEAIASRSRICGEVVGTNTMNSLAIRMTVNGIPLVDLEVGLAVGELEEVTCRLNAFGWCQLEVDYASDTSAQLRVLSEDLSGLDLTQGHVYLSYGEPSSSVFIHQELTWSNRAIIEGISFTFE